METPAHRRLKQLALNSLRQWGCLAVATEVRCPGSKYRVDVAGYRDRNHRGDAGATEAAGSVSVLIECKQARSDFLRDGDDKQRLIRHRDRLTRMRRSIERHSVQRYEPHLQQHGSTLFPETDEWDYSASRLASYRKVVRRLRRVSERIHGHTKFCLAARYHLADFMFIAAPQGLVRPSETPPGWGLLQCPPDWIETDNPAGLFDGPPVLNVAIRAPRHDAHEKNRNRLLRNIAVTASRRAFPGMASAGTDMATAFVEPKLRAANPGAKATSASDRPNTPTIQDA